MRRSMPSVQSGLQGIKNLEQARAPERKGDNVLRSVMGVSNALHLHHRRHLRLHPPPRRCCQRHYHSHHSHYHYHHGPIPYQGRVWRPNQLQKVNWSRM